MCVNFRTSMNIEQQGREREREGEKCFVGNWKESGGSFAPLDEFSFTGVLLTTVTYVRM